MVKKKNSSIGKKGITLVSLIIYIIAFMIMGVITSAVVISIQADRVRIEEKMLESEEFSRLVAYTKKLLKHTDQEQIVFHNEQYLIKEPKNGNGKITEFYVGAYWGGKIYREKQNNRVIKNIVVSRMFQERTTGYKVEIHIPYADLEIVNVGGQEKKILKPDKEVKLILKKKNVEVKSVNIYADEG